MASPYMLPSDLRSITPLGDPTKFPDAILARYISIFETRAESYRGVAFTPRTVTETLPIPPWTTLMGLPLTWPKVRSITSLTVDGLTIAPAAYQFNPFTSSLMFWYGLVGLSVSVTYDHGFDAPPAAPYGLTVTEACAQYVRSRVLNLTSGAARDTISLSTPDGGTTRYSTPDAAAGRPTGLMAVDEMLNALPDFRQPGIG